MKKHVPLALTFVLSLSLFAGAASSSSSGAAGSSSTSAYNPALQPIQHIIFMLQENRSFDHYFGHLNAYRATLGLPAAADDLVNPQETLNPNPTHDGSTCPGSPTGTCTPFKMVSDCIEDLTPAWNEAHVDLTDNLSSKVLMNGFAREAGTYSIAYKLLDTSGWRAMGYYDYTQLNYYYYLATQFATSDRWFSPVLTKSEPNHLFGLAGTAQGWINVPTKQLSAPTIFNLLQKANISWKVYYTDTIPKSTKPDTYISYFSQLTPYMSTNVAPMSQYYTDLENGTLPQVALIEAGRDSGLDEHPQNNLIVGAKAAQKVINAFLSSSSYQDSVFILTWDEGGGMYDHVPPAATVNPDGIAPNLASDPNVKTTFGDNFTKTGFRVPLLVISPWTKTGYVSHKVADYTAILKLIEARFNLSSLTLRDAAQPDMSDFFDFVNVPNSAAPTPPAQHSGVACYYTSVP